MNNILIKSQDGKFTGFCRYIGIGARNPKAVIVNELKKLLEEKNMTSDDLINLVGNSYRDNIKRILDNQDPHYGRQKNNGKGYQHCRGRELP